VRRFPIDAVPASSDRLQLLLQRAAHPRSRSAIDI